MIDRLLSFFAPHSCCGCGNIGDLLCQNCKNDIVTEPFSGCLLCLKPTVHNNLCHACAKRSHIEAAWVVGVRESSLKTLLDRYKFDSAKQAGTTCAELLDKRLPMLRADVAVVPVPTAPAHQRVRGFDHTALIAKGLANRRALSCRLLLSRVDGSTQHFKTRRQRLAGAAITLQVRSNVPETVLLIDDIYTTGATIASCANSLRQAGVKQLYVAVIARQTLDETRDL